MATDFQVIFPSQIIELSSVTILQGVTPKTLDVIGTDFRTVDEVRVNDIVATSSIVLSKKRMLVHVPALLEQSAITSLTVTSNTLSMTPRSLIRFRLGRSTSKVSGVLRLMQVFLKVLFSTPNRDIFAPRIGGAALKNLGMTFGAEGSKQLISDFVISVATTSRQILAIQSRDSSIPLEERLMSAKVLAAKYNRQEEALIVSLELLSQTGQTALANLAI